MNDLDTLLNDPDLGGASFTVHRTAYRRTRGSLTPTESVFPASGAIHPGTPEMLRLLPEEQRSERFIQIHTSTPLTAGDNAAPGAFSAADRITWDGETWRVVRVRDWPAFHYYQALAVLLREEDSP